MATLIAAEAVRYAASFPPARLLHMLREDLDFRYNTPSATAGVLLIRSMPNDQVLSAARAWNGDAWDSAAFEWIRGRMPADTNPCWIEARAADVAYDRGLISGPEHDLITA